MKKNSKSYISLVVLGISLLLSSCGDENAPLTDQNSTKPNQTATNIQNNRLATIKQRGRLICGINGQLPGFSFVNENGEYSGMDVDICRAIAAALFDDPTKVEYRTLSTQERFTAVQSGEVDILSRNTTYTLSRDTSVGLEFAPITFYDGQGIIVSRASGIKTIEALKGKTICVQAGTTSELNLTDQMRKRGIDYTPVVFDDADAMYAAYQQGRCQGATSDRSQLSSRRTAFPKPDDHIVLDAVISKEPLAVAVANGDTAWSDVVKWTIYTLIEAEEQGITSKNIGTFTNSQDPTVKRFLGTEGELGTDMGLSNDFATRIITHVGNYSEIYERNITKNLGLERGFNQLWTKGGLLYSPPFR
ncbi:amino acid ABC transporter substrate-binding protein [Chroococcus sp. FPU101]|uniref:amino acid ABC transporter substrate-binding protein n=1 Tax=Chroococcus sp. FPU101 TaxID=1974212 RepID=UPI001A8EE302|nr:amino acid ABC transporter substrate-binding protein [Chroococcus sp. FPU101]GFE69281.1 extracellular solute-binding protein family 3 [Chroococcus sp. FPU101]